MRVDQNIQNTDIMRLWPCCGDIIKCLSDTNLKQKPNKAGVNNVGFPLVNPKELIISYY